MVFIKELLFFLLLNFAIAGNAFAQKQISGRSEPVQFSLFSTQETGVASRISLKNSYQPDFDVINIDSLPPAVPLRPNSVAIVLGVEQYEFLPSSFYSSRDAKLMARYFKNLLGVEKVILHTDKDISGFFFDNLFDAEEGELSRVIVDGKTDLYVFYSGHGMPSENGSEIYVLPVDTKMRLLERQGYSLNNLLSQLSLLNTKSTTVFIDACFSGLGKYSQSSNPVSLTRTRGIKVKPLLNQPWINNPEFRVFTSSSGNQTSLVFDESQTGLFTYFLATGLLGHADLNKDGQITMSELDEYLIINVSTVSKKIYQEQIPHFYGDKSFVLINND